ncbi:type I-E CRISPR-associated protein Cse2/CasB [Anthocerotibacter panamensis]|uniref:type I-E CRISPR-associated protein Cse2/CasB n=1 Tax=Anthocerotibacter panamensis TaxID=2857077 RepID=UPI001C404765|nr:type I-E CRISPR-associated protein Cse2/CasB [Anthocerotibacter panamensis]
MSTVNSPPRWERAHDYLERLHKRVASDNGAQAELKRALSGEPRHVRAVFPYLIPLIDGTKAYQQKQVWIPVACLSVYYPQPLRADQQSFGSSCRGLADKRASGGTERRFRALLDTDLIDLRTPLTALVRQMKTKEVRIDYPRLIADLCSWDHPEQFVQDRWARDFWQGEEA